MKKNVVNENNKKASSEINSNRLLLADEDAAAETSSLEKSSNSLSLNESFIHNSRVNLLMKQAAETSSPKDNNKNSNESFLRNSQYQTYQTRNLNSGGFSGAKFQCNKCPCKYKRSSDLSNHLKQKHSIHQINLKDYLTNETTTTSSTATMAQI